jgi:periplasmic divalent cation tolerance protein
MTVSAELATLAITTVATPAQAESLVRGLLARGLIGCGTMLPNARSMYRWAGSVAEEPETVILLKTHANQLDAIEAAFADLHPYDVPELIALPVAAGSAAYLRWLAGAITNEPHGSAS